MAGPLVSENLARRVDAGDAKGDRQRQHDPAEGDGERGENDARRHLELLKGHRQDQHREQQPDPLGDQPGVAVAAVDRGDEHSPAHETGHQVPEQDEQHRRNDARQVEEGLGDEQPDRLQLEDAQRHHREDQQARPEGDRSHGQGGLRPEILTAQQRRQPHAIAPAVEMEEVEELHEQALQGPGDREPQDQDGQHRHEVRAGRRGTSGSFRGTAPRPSCRKVLMGHSFPRVQQRSR